MKMGLSRVLKTLFDLEADWRHQTINLNASENYTSAAVKKMLSHPSYDFYSFPPSGGEIEGPWRFSKPSYLQQIDEHINKLGQKLLHCETLDCRLKGGQGAEIAVIMGLANTGDHVFYVQESDGGHFGLSFVSKKMGVRLIPISFDDEKHQIDITQTLENMNKIWKNDGTRKLMMIGQSFMLKTLHFKELIEKVKSKFSNVIVCCDVSHVLGLIVGKQYINPILEGVDLIHGSTHKTFPGPMKAIVGFPYHLEQNIREVIQCTISPGLQSNGGTAEVLALALVLEEMEIYGEKYAKAVCQHAKYFAQLLNGFGFNVVGKAFGFTETHQVWVVIGDEHKAWQAFSALHNVGIRTFPAHFPFIRQWGLRFSMHAITRLGFESEDIFKVAEFIKHVLVDQVSTNIVKNRVVSLMKQFNLNQVKYGFALEGGPVCDNEE